MKNPLDDIAISFGTDKSSLTHDYTSLYWKIFKEKRTSVKDLLEIGVLNGSSIRTWKKFFESATIRAIDVNPSCLSLEEDRIEISIGRQEDQEFLKRTYLDKNIEFDVIVDDGSHISDHQIASFEFLFENCLRQGGTYVIEDVCCSYWPSHNGGLKKSGTCIEYFKEKIDEINFGGLMIDGRVDRRRSYLSKQGNASSHQLQIDSITFSNSLIIIDKL
ncbi:MAG: hypothetical protein EBV73_06820 [Rhodocyclales bacterium]|nr:hypothetical protein [Rhodocyclales bacterium]